MIVKLRSPWVLYHEKLKALFAEDGEVKVEFDESSSRPKYTLRVSSVRKADALARLIDPVVEFGGVSASIAVIPPNDTGDALPDDACAADVVAAAFEGNPAVTQVRQVSKGMFRDLAYCVFRRDAVQYPADNLADINGNETTLMEEIAREVFTSPVAGQVYFCTSAGAKLGGGLNDAPLGEWP